MNTLKRFSFILIPIILFSIFNYNSSPIGNEQEVTLDSYKKGISGEATMIIQSIDHGIITYDIEATVPKGDYNYLVISKPYFEGKKYYSNKNEGLIEWVAIPNNTEHHISKLIDITSKTTTSTYRYNDLRTSFPINRDNINLTIALTTQPSGTTNNKQKAISIDKLTIINTDKIMELNEYKEATDIKTQRGATTSRIEKINNPFFNTYNLKFKLRDSYNYFSVSFIVLLILILGIAHKKLLSNPESEYSIPAFIIAIVFGLLPTLEILNVEHPDQNAIIGTVRYSVYIWIAFIILCAILNIKSSKK
ncbi:hypothetical protein [Labilibaculum euxinus]|uniref:Uncharacterized protein n=1 Tax=Labilibaculum euxinus TaxID=2686357 RepID=A0A7M4D6J0_9BACT|nr:hypothetical protein [Labilibaculum euxinus]MUP38269.1 hypothetical protein [Labilibaculum euxinus]MVB07474.1 hypothetical protein [Labilibaculum euxinus]